jgi:tyrosyl-tRNA synthetase
MDLLDELAARGLIHDTTDRATLESRLASGPIGLYIGFDPTADSLHVGHLVGQLFMRRFQLHGHRPFPLAGGATGMIGDPTGRSDERNLLDVDTLRHNVERIEEQLRKLLDFEPGPSRATLVNNADWTERVVLLEFLRDIGRFATVNQMLARDSVRTRLEGEGGLSYTEFSYALLQANDFRHLYEHHQVELQAGASDQWGNIVAGVDLIRRRLGAQAFAMTHPLIIKADGTKFGKSGSGTVWLDPQRTSPFQFRQFWVQSDDETVATYLKMLSMRPLVEIEAILAEHALAPDKRVAQRALADEMTAMVHGPGAQASAMAAADILFGDDAAGAPDDAWAMLARELPTVELTAPVAERRVHEVLIGAGLASSTSDVNRLLKQRGVRVNARVVGEDGALEEADLVGGRYVLVRKGRRDHVIGIVGGARSTS